MVIINSLFPHHPQGTLPRARFGLGNAIEVYRQALQPVTPSLDSFLRGEIPLRRWDGQVVTARVLPTTVQDAAVVDGWYEPAPDGGPSYSVNPKWREWWTEKITRPLPNWRVLKLVDPNNVVLGVVSIVKDFLEQPGDDPGRPVKGGQEVPNLKPMGNAAKPLTWVKGIRIAPRCNSMMTKTPDYKGVGSAMMAQVVVQSIENGDAGVGLNSTLGAEGFYQAMNMRSKPSLDGIRTSFFAEGFAERLAFLKGHYEKWQRLLSPAPEKTG